MKSITIHNLDHTLASLIEKEAREKGLSQNKTIKILLRQALGLSPIPEPKKHDFSDVFGVWGEDEFREFQEKTADFATIDPEDWK